MARLKTGKRQVTPVVTAEDAKKSKPIVVKMPEDENGRVNDAFQKAERHADPARSQEESPRTRPQDTRDDREPRGFDQDPRERSQNFENGRAVRDSQRYREFEVPRAIVHDPDRRIEDSRIIYKSRDIYQRPIDEIDTPRFPTEYEKNGNGPLFARIVNPSVKIMKVERDVEEALDNYHRWFLASGDSACPRFGNFISKRAAMPASSILDHAVGKTHANDSCLE